MHAQAWNDLLLHGSPGLSMGGHEHPGENLIKGQSQQGTHAPLHHSKTGLDEGEKWQKWWHCNGQVHCVLLGSMLTGLWQCVYGACTLDVC